MTESHLTNNVAPYPCEGGEVGPVNQNHSDRLAVLLHPGCKYQSPPQTSVLSPQSHKLQTFNGGTLSSSCHCGGEAVSEHLDWQLRVEVGGDGDGEGGAVICGPARDIGSHLPPDLLGILAVR